MQLGPKIRIDSHSFGNAIKNLSPAAGLLGGPLGFAAAGGLSALGDVARGKKVSVGNALTNATLGSGLNAAKGAIANHAAGAATPSGLVSNGNGGWAGYGAHAGDGAAADATLPGGFHLPGVARSAFNFAGDHDKVAGAVLNTGGSLLMGGAGRRAADTDARLGEQRLLEDQYDFARRKARNERLAPAWSALGGSFNNSVAANPYLPTGG